MKTAHNTIYMSDSQILPSQNKKINLVVVFLDFQISLLFFIWAQSA